MSEPPAERVDSLRRQLLQGAGSLALLLGLGDRSWAQVPAAAPPRPARLSPELLGHHDQLEPLIRWLIDVPSDRALDGLAAELAKGTAIDAVFSALFSAATRVSDFHHAVFVVHAAYEIGQALEPADQPLPLYWSLAYFKNWQGRMRGMPLPRRSGVEARYPSAAHAERAFREAMARMDTEAAEPALLALAAERDSRHAMDVLWHFGARDWSFVGHRAIAVTNARLALDRIGWHHAGSALRFLNGFMGYWYAEDGLEQSYATNLERVARLGRRGRPFGQVEVAPEHLTLELLGAMRRGVVEDACELAFDALLATPARAAAVWDAVHLAAAELMMRARSGAELGGYPLHAVTAANALRTAFHRAEDAPTRDLVILQAVGWMAEFTRACRERDGLRALSIDRLEPAGIAATSRAAADEILDTLAPGPGLHKRPPAAPGSHDEAASKALAYGQRFDDPSPFVRTALRQSLRKALTNPHDLKYPVAIFEDALRVHPRWRPHLLAASVYRLPSSRAPESPVYQAMRAAFPT